MSAEAFRLEAGPEARGRRVDQVLAQLLPQLSRARLQALMAQGQVRVDGKPARPSHRLKGGEALEVDVPPPAPAEPTAQDLPLSRLYEDADLVVLDKAAGMVVHPGAGHDSGTLVNALLHHVTDLKGIGGELRPGIVHRLDKDTSGVLVVAKHDQALRTLQQAFKSREVHKVYLALVHGHPPGEGHWTTLYGRHPKHRVRFSSKVKQGKTAQTRYRVSRYFAHAARAEVELLTGRTHQIRVHFADHGFPLLGDELYGTKASRRPEIIGRQALHAWKLSFPHPSSGKRLTFEAPVPADFATAERRLAKER